MKKIICNIKPFEMNQQVYVFEDGEKIVSNNCDSLEMVVERILFLAKEYGIDTVDLAGVKQFNLKLQSDILSTELTRFGCQNLTVNLI